MLIEFSLGGVVRRALIAAAALFVGGWLLKIIFIAAVAATLIDPRFEFDYQTLSDAAGLAGNSSGLLKRLAETESELAGDYLEPADRHITEAARLEPLNYEIMLAAGSIKEMRGHNEEAEQYFKRAVALAPNFSDSRWILGNFLLRRGRMPEATAEFKRATALDPELAVSIFNLLWQKSPQNMDYLQEITDGDELLKLKLALFFSSRADAAETETLVKTTNREFFSKSKEAGLILDNLLNGGETGTAKRIWAYANVPETGQNSQEPGGLLWNGNFEMPANPQYSQFDWQLKSSDYARAEIAADGAGSQFLRISFTGKDTVRLADEAKHYLVLENGKHYRFSFRYRTKDFSAGEGPRWILGATAGGGSKNETGAARQIKLGETASLAASETWKTVTLEFSVPAAAGGRGRKNPGPAETDAILYLSKTPHYSFEEPLHGEMFFDDFAISEIPAGQSKPS